MANTQSQFGFIPYGYTSGKQANFSLRRRSMAYNYGSSIYFGDPVASDANGNIIKVSSQTAPVAGIFRGCQYYDPVQKIFFKSKSWKTPTLASTQTVDAFILDDPDNLYLIAELGSTAALTLANVGNNAQWVAGTAPAATSDISTYCLDDGNITVTATLPIKIWDLYSTYAAPGQNGADNTSIYNWAVVKLNQTDRQPGTTGI
jgi:hypothetical protein